MIPLAQVWLALGCLLLSAGTLAASRCALRSARLRSRLHRYELRLERHLRYLQLRVPARRLCGAQLAAACAALAVALAARSPWLLAVAAAAGAVPEPWLARAARTRTARIEAQLDGWMLALSNALRANPALGAAIAASAEVIAPPLSRELAIVERERQLGVALDHALAHMAQRVASPTVGAALAILRVARATGGDLSHTLEAAAASLREMARLEGVVRAKTAEGRAQTAVIAAAPLGLVAMLDAIDPHLFAPLWSTPLGHLLVAGATSLWVAALLLARKIVDVDI